MKRRKIVARICAFLLTASLIATHAMPALAAEVSKEPTVEHAQVLEDISVETTAPVEDEEAEKANEHKQEPEAALPEGSSEPSEDTGDISGLPEGTDDNSELSEDTGNNPELPDGTEDNSKLPKDTGNNSELPDGAKRNLKLPDDTAEKSETLPTPETEDNQDTESGKLENKDGLIYMDGMLYQGYYMDNADIFYTVSNGAAKPFTGIANEGISYYNYQDNKFLTLPKQTLFVMGKVYTGYYMDSTNTFYIVSNGETELVTGTIKKGTSYYSFPSSQMMSLSKQTLYIKGKVYTGYFMSRKNKMYRVKKGTSTLTTGTLKAGTKYYNYNTGKTKKLSKKTLYVKGKVYTGYYTDSKNKMYRVKKGILTLKTGALKANTKYFSYHAQKTRKLSKKTLYVKGKVYTGYYLNQKNKMYRVEKGTSALLNTGLNAGTKYYSSHAKKTLKLKQLTVYVNGKAMEGMSPESLATLQRAQTVLASITNDSMSKEEKLRTCFEFVKTYQGGRPRIPHYTGMDWPVVYANDMFLNDGKGNCFSYAAAFAYLAKAIGYEEVYCCSSGDHGWAEINGLIYDPERNKFDPSYSYYGLSYDTKTNVNHKAGIAAGEPWMHIKI